MLLIVKIKNYINSFQSIKTQKSLYFIKNFANYNYYKNILFSKTVCFNDDDRIGEKWKMWLKFKIKENQCFFLAYCWMNICLIGLIFMISTLL